MNFLMNWLLILGHGALALIIMKPVLINQQGERMLDDLYFQVMYVDLYEDNLLQKLLKENTEQMLKKKRHIASIFLQILISQQKTFALSSPVHLLNPLHPTCLPNS